MNRSGKIRSEYHVTHPSFLLQKQLVLNVIIVQTLEKKNNQWKTQTSHSNELHRRQNLCHKLHRISKVRWRLCSLYKRITATLANSLLRFHTGVVWNADMLCGWVDWFYLELKWKQLLIVRNLFRFPPERVLRHKRDNRKSLTDPYWILTCDTFSHVGNPGSQQIAENSEERRDCRDEKQYEDSLGKKNPTLTHLIIYGWKNYCAQTI